MSKVRIANIDVKKITPGGVFGVASPGPQSYRAKITWSDGTVTEGTGASEESATKDAKSNK